MKVYQNYFFKYQLQTTKTSTKAVATHLLWVREFFLEIGCCGDTGLEVAVVVGVAVDVSCDVDA